MTVPEVAEHKKWKVEKNKFSRHSLYLMPPPKEPACLVIKTPIRLLPARASPAPPPLVAQTLVCAARARCSAAGSQAKAYAT